MTVRFPQDVSVDKTTRPARVFMAGLIEDEVRVIRDSDPTGMTRPCQIRGEPNPLARIRQSVPAPVTGVAQSAAVRLELPFPRPVAQAAVVAPDAPERAVEAVWRFRRPEGSGRPGRGSRAGCQR